MIEDILICSFIKVGKRDVLFGHIHSSYFSTYGQTDCRVTRTGYKTSFSFHTVDIYDHMC